MPIAALVGDTGDTVVYTYAVEIHDEVFARQGNAVRLVPNAALTLYRKDGITPAVIYSDDKFTVANTAGIVTTADNGVWTAFLDPTYGPYIPEYKGRRYDPIPVGPDSRESDYDLKKFATDHGINPGEVVASKNWVADLLADVVPESGVGLSEAQVKAIVDDAISAIPQGDPGAVPDLSPFARIRGDQDSRDIIVTTTAPTTLKNATLGLTAAGKIVVLEAATSQAPNTGAVTPPPTSNVTEWLPLSHVHYTKTYVTAAGRPSGSTDAFVSTLSLARTLEQAVISQDRSTFDLVFGWAEANFKRTTQTTAKNLYGSTYTIASSSVTNWIVDSGAMLTVFGALFRAWNLWGGENYHKTASLILSDLVNTCVIYDQGRAYLASDEQQRAVSNNDANNPAFGHHTHPGNGGYMSMLNPGAINVVHFKSAKTFTGNAIFDKLLDGHGDIISKLQAKSSRGLISDYCSYNTATHDVNVITNGTDGWTSDRSQLFGSTAQRGLAHMAGLKLLYGDGRYDTVLAKARAFFTSKWQTDGKIVSPYDTNGVAQGTAETSELYLIAARLLLLENGGDSVGLAIKATKYPAVQGSDANGYFIPYQIKDVVPVSSRDLDLNAWLAFARDNGTYSDITKLGSNPSVGVLTPATGTGTTSPPVVVVTPSPGTGSGGTAPTVPTGALKLFADPNPDRFSAKRWALTLPNGTAQEQIWRRRALDFAGVPSAQWIGDWDEQANGAKLYIDDATNAGAVAQLLSYRIPGRDMGSYSGGGAANRASYETYIRNLAIAIGTRKVVLGYEPDSLPHMSAMSQEQRDGRSSIMKWAIQYLRSKCPNLYIYVDAGHSNWLGVDATVQLLRLVGIENANGIATNVSNFRPDAEIVQWSQNVIKALNIPGMGFIYDSGRNGNPTAPRDSDFPAGDNDRFANPRGRQIGQLPQFGGTGLPDLCHGRVWWKRQGESDGNNGDGAPNAGDFFALQLLNTSVGDNVYGNSNYNSSGYLQRAPYAYNGSSGNAGSGAVA